MSSTTRGSLLHRLCDANDAEAWRVFNDRYRPLLLSYCRAQGLQTWDADDVCQTVMAAVSSTLRNGFTYAPENGRFRAYLGRAARNAIRAQRAKSQAGPTPTAPGRLDETNAQRPEEWEAVWEREWRRHHLRLALAAIRDAISARSMEIFDRLLEGDAPLDVAARFGMTEAAVHKVKQRVRDRLKLQILAQLCDEDGADDAA